MEIRRPTFKAKALNLRKVRRHLTRCHTVCSNTNDILITHVLRLIERQCCLTGQYSDLPLLGRKLPFKHVGYRGVESDAETLGMLPRYKLFGGESSLVRNGGATVTGTLADGAVEGDGGVCKC